MGEAPVVAVRKKDGSISAVLNRCAHKGSVLCFKPHGNISEFNCVYHNWVYDLDGKLQGVAFRRGVGGKGGVGPDFDDSRHNLQRLRVETYGGMVFGTFSDQTPPFHSYLGDELLANIERLYQAAEGAGLSQPGSAQQLEALRREQQGLLSRLPLSPATWGVKISPNTGAGII